MIGNTSKTDQRRWERQDEGLHRTHVRHGNAVRVWLRRPWFSSGDGEQLGVVLEPATRLPLGWERIAGTELTAKNILRQPQVSTRPLRRVAAPPQNQPRDAAAGLTADVVGLEISIITADIVALTTPPGSTSEETKRMLRPYVTAWGSDPIWKSVTPALPPTVADFPRHAGYATGLTLEELPSTVTITVAAHDVYFDRARKLWYCDIEIHAGNSYFPFVRLALARYQAHSLTNAHLSRVVMSDFIQLAPDRTAEVALSPGSAAITVRGFSGRNFVADIPPSSFLDPALFASGTQPNTTMRVALERRVPGVPGDLGWERVGGEITLSAAASGFHVTWTGTIKLPANLDETAGGYRLLVTESETFLRDLIAFRVLEPNDPPY